MQGEVGSPRRHSAQGAQSKERSLGSLFTLWVCPRPSQNMRQTRKCDIQGHLEKDTLAQINFSLSSELWRFNRSWAGRKGQVEKQELLVKENSRSSAGTNRAAPSLGLFPASKQPAFRAVVSSALLHFSTLWGDSWPPTQAICSQRVPMTYRLPHTTASLCPCISRISNVIPCLICAWNFASLPFGCSLIAYNTLIATVSLSCQCYCCFQHFCLTPPFLTFREHPRLTSQSYLHSWSCITGPFSGFRTIYPAANWPSIGIFPRNLKWNVSQIYSP